MIQKLRSRKGFAGIDYMIFAFAAVTIYGGIQEHKGRWGANGTDNLQAREAKIIANGGHINQAPCDDAGECKF